MTHKKSLSSLTLDCFENRVRIAARKLQKMCPQGKASDAQIFEAAKSSDLPVLFESASYTLDPSATIVALVAFKNAGEKEIKKYFQMVRNQHVRR